MVTWQLVMLVEDDKDVDKDEHDCCCYSDGLDDCEMSSNTSHKCVLF